jgi:hypothetical protein
MCAKGNCTQPVADLDDWSRLGSRRRPDERHRHGRALLDPGERSASLAHNRGIRTLYRQRAVTCSR